MNHFRDELIAHISPYARGNLPGVMVEIRPDIANTKLWGYRSLEDAARNRLNYSDVLLSGNQRGLVIALVPPSPGQRLRWMLVLSSSGLLWIDVCDVRPAGHP